MENKMTTTAIALAFSKSEEIGAVRSTVAWTMAACDMILGWNGTATKGGKDAVIKQLREVYGYRKDADGNPVFNDKGAKVKRSAIFARLSLVSEVIGYLLKHGRDHIQALNDAAVSDDGDTMTETVERIASELTAVCGDDTIDALSHFLKTGKAKEKEAAKVATDAATGTDTATTLAAASATTLSVAEVITWIMAYGHTVSDMDFRAMQNAVQNADMRRDQERQDALAEETEQKAA